MALKGAGKEKDSTATQNIGPLVYYCLWFRRNDYLVIHVMTSITFFTVRVINSPEREFRIHIFLM